MTYRNDRECADCPFCTEHTAMVGALSRLDERSVDQGDDIKEVKAGTKRIEASISKLVLRVTLIAALVAGGSAGGGAVVSRLLGVPAASAQQTTSQSADEPTSDVDEGDETTTRRHR